MAINKQLLYDKVSSTLNKKQSKISFDLPLILYLLEKTIFNDPTQNCIIKGKKSNWEGLPKSKSLFHADEACGLPIGNLTSQLFGNVYMNNFDHFVKKQLKIKYYGRYVDDFILIHSDKEYLKNCISFIRDYLREKLHLALHPNKIYLQHYSRGVQYLGAVIKPHRIYIANRTKGNFYKAIAKQNKIIEYQNPTKNARKTFESSMNSYLGIMRHYKTYNLRYKFVFKRLNKKWFRYFYLTGGLFQFKAKKTINKEMVSN